MQCSIFRFQLFALFSVLLVLSGCEKPNYTVVAENTGGAFRIEQVQVIAKDRRWAEPGLTISGRIRGNFSPDTKPVILMKMTDGMDAELLTTFDLAAVAEMYGADLKIGKNDERYEGAVEWNDQSNIEIEPGDTLHPADTTQPVAPTLPLVPKPVVMHQPVLAGAADFSFFVPWRALPAHFGMTDFHFAMIVLPDSLNPSDQPMAFFGKETVLQDPKNGYLKIKVPVVQEKIAAYQILVSEVQLDTTQFDPSDMDFTLGLGSNPRAGYPDIFWSVTVGNWLTWSSPRYKNSVSGHWETPSSPIYLYDNDPIGICIFDFDDTTRDDEIGCWEGSLGDISATPDRPKTIACTNVKFMRVFAEEIKEAGSLAGQ